MWVDTYAISLVALRNHSGHPSELACIAGDLAAYVAECLIDA
jgi:hypothetical protein